MLAQRAVEIAPAHPGAPAVLAELLFAAGEELQAANMLNSEVISDVASEETRAEALSVYARVNPKPEPETRHP